MIKDFLLDITKAKDSGAYLSALALALTIPDICGKVEGNGNNDREKYINWFNEWIYKFFELPKSDNPMFDEHDDLVIFDGLVCYALRCAFLHCGSVKLKENTRLNIKLDRVELCIVEGEWQFGDSHGCYLSDGEVIETHRRFNVINLLDAFIQGTQEYLKACGDNSRKYAAVNIIKF